MSIPADKKHLYDICTTTAQRLGRWADVVQMLYRWFFVYWDVIGSFFFSPGAPASPTDLTILVLESSLVVISWKYPNRSDVSHFEMHIGTVNRTVSDARVSRVLRDTRRKDVSQLLPDTQYFIYLVTYSTDGMSSNNSDVIRFTTTPGQSAEMSTVIYRTKSKDSICLLYKYCILALQSSIAYFYLQSALLTVTMHQRRYRSFSAWLIIDRMQQFASLKNGLISHTFYKDNFYRTVFNT